MDADYVFRVRFRLDPRGVQVTPREFETVVRRPAAQPGEEGWLFFRDHLWRGAVSDEPHIRDLAEGWLDVPVTAVSFSELRTDEAYLAALREAIAHNLGAFNAASVDEVLKKYLGSSIRLPETDG